MSAVKKPIKTEDSQENPSKGSTKRTTKKAETTTPAVKSTTKRTTKKAETTRTAKKTETTTESQPDLIGAAKSGDRLATLIALRDLLAERLQNTSSSRDVSSISRRLMQCVCEIEALEKLKKETEQRSFSLYDFQKNIFKGAATENRAITKAIIENKRAIDRAHTLNELTAEHERF